MTAPIPDATGVVASSPRSAARRARPVIVQLATRRPLAFAALLLLLLVLIIAVIGPDIAPYDPLSGDLSAAMQGPSWAHLLGTDQLGRDTFSRLLVGTGPTVLYTSLVVLAALIAGVLLGMIAGYAGRRVDAGIMALSDILLSLPGMVMLLVILTVFQDVMWIAMLWIGVLMSGVLMRVIRATTLSFRQEAFIEAATVAGLPQWMILWRHILPRISSAILVQGSMLIGMALLLVTGAAYLGFGTNPPYPSWGLMIGDGAQIFGSQPWLMVSAGVVTALTAMAAAILGEGVRDVTTERWSGRRVRRRAPRRVERRHGHPAGVGASTPTPAGPLLQVSGLEIAYGHPDDMTRVVHGIDLTVDAGQTVGLVGESGSGKTATARAILGILRGGRITGGRVLLDGADITGIADFSPAERTRLGIGYVAQEPHLALDPNWTVGAQLVEALRHARTGLTKADARLAAVELLGSVRLHDVESVMRKYPFELSGGMAQRVVIARALCEDPKLLVADEPTTALDVTVQAEILDLLRDIQQRTGMAILIITHDWGVVADLCSKAVVMRNGLVREEADVADIFDRPGDEYTASLLASNPAMMASRAARAAEYEESGR